MLSGARSLAWVPWTNRMEKAASGTRLKSRRDDKEQEKRKIFCLQRVSLACLLCKTATLRISALLCFCSNYGSRAGKGVCDEWLKNKAKEGKRKKKKRMSWQACKMSRDMKPLRDALPARSLLFAVLPHHQYTPLA